MLLTQDHYLPHSGTTGRHGSRVEGLWRSEIGLAENEGVGGGQTQPKRIPCPRDELENT